MRYFDYLESNKKGLVEQLERLFTLYKVEPVGNGYIDCIVIKDNLNQFVNEISAVGVIISGVSWWCYVNPTDSNLTGCPHGMGGPKSEYYKGWFSELQNDLLEVDKKRLNSILNVYDKQSVYSINTQTLVEIQKSLKIPFKYTPTDYIQGNKCVTPGLWLLVPETWKRI